MGQIKETDPLSPFSPPPQNQWMKGVLLIPVGLQYGDALSFSGSFMMSFLDRS